MKTKRSLGQHFLVSGPVKERIRSVLKAHSAKAASVLEIGPGSGAITEMIVTLGLPFSAIEKDNDLAPKLREKYAGLTVIEDDARSFDLENLPAGSFPIMIVGNLPYYAGTEIVLNILSSPSRISTAHFMLQKEVALKFGSLTGEEYYSKYSVWAKAFYEVKIEFDVGRGAFTPPPKVLSAVVTFTPLEKPLIDENDSHRFFKFAEKMFLHPRKKFSSNFEGEEKQKVLKILKEHGVKEEARPGEVEAGVDAELFVKQKER